MSRDELQEINQKRQIKLRKNGWLLSKVLNAVPIPANQDVVVYGDVEPDP